MVEPPCANICALWILYNNHHSIVKPLRQTSKANAYASGKQKKNAVKALFGKMRNRAAQRQKNYIMKYYQLLSIIFNSIKLSGNRKFTVAESPLPQPQPSCRRQQSAARAVTSMKAICGKLNGTPLTSSFDPAHRENLQIRHWQKTASPTKQ